MSTEEQLSPEMLRVIQEVAPRWIIGENVSGIIPMELDTVLSDLEVAGYTCWTFVIPACAVDAHHRRDRVWVIGYSDSNLQSSQRKIPRGKKPKSSRIRADAHSDSNSKPDGSVDAETCGQLVAHTISGSRWDTATLEESGRGATNSLNDFLTMQEEHGSLNPTWVEWLMGFPIGHTDLKPSVTQ